MDPDTRKQINALWTQFDHLWAALGYTQEYIEHRRTADEIGKQVEDFRNELSRQTLDSIEASNRYNNVIALVGYAGYFAIWSFTKEHISKQDSGLIAISGLVSISSFVIWSIVIMLHNSYWIIRQSKIINKQFLPDEFFNEFNKLKFDQGKSSSAYFKFWAALFLISIISALIGGVFLFKNFIIMITNS